MKSAPDSELIIKSNLFDPKWYQDRYPDVVASGFNALEHFIRFGLAFDRDPGPAFCSTFYRHAIEPDRLSGDLPLIHYLQHPDHLAEGDLVLHAAMQVFLQGRHTTALNLARDHLPQHLQQTVAALEANIAWLANDMTGWQTAVNRYLTSYGLAPLALQSAQSILGQLHCGPLPKITDGPIISVIMPVWNAEKTVAIAIASILEQTWRPLEVIVVDDASTDDSWGVLQKVAATDPRVKVLRNARNVGPYVSKNRGLKHAQGAYITGHDADDWAHPERLATHMRILTSSPAPLPVSIPYGLRMQPDGIFSHTRRAGVARSFDGWMQSTPIGTLFDASFLRNKLGYWDSIRFGADTEILLRSRHILGRGALEIPLMSMICLDAAHSLSNHAIHGTRAQAGGLSAVRRAYLHSVRTWLQKQPTGEAVFLDFPQGKPRYDTPEEMQVPKADVLANISKRPV